MGLFRAVKEADTCPKYGKEKNGRCRKAPKRNVGKSKNKTRVYGVPERKGESRQKRLQQEFSQTKEHYTTNSRNLMNAKEDKYRER